MRGSSKTKQAVTNTRAAAAIYAAAAAEPSAGVGGGAVLPGQEADYAGLTASVSRRLP